MKQFLFIAALFMLSSCEVQNNYRYEVSGTTDAYDVVFLNSKSEVQECKDVGNSIIYEFLDVEGYKYFSAENQHNGIVIISVYKNNKLISTRQTDGERNKIEISGIY